MIKVSFNGNIYEIAESMKVDDFFKNVAHVDDPTIIACKAFSEVKSLDYIIERDCIIEPLTTKHSDGSKIYVRGLTFILVKAFEELYPNHKFHVNFALGHALYCNSDFDLTQEDVNRIKDRMHEIVSENLPIEKKIIPLSEAMRLFQETGQEDKRRLLDNRMKTYVSMYYCGNTSNYFYGVMPISTGYTKNFEVSSYENGLLLHYPRRFASKDAPSTDGSKKLYATFNEYDKIHNALGISTIAGLNKYIREGKAGDLIRVSEALHEKKIAQIADMIAADRKRKIVLIAGPSSSGKTTFAQRLGVQLKVNGIKAVTLSMDNYFVNRDDTPKDENGKFDFECLEAVDLALFNQQLKELLEGKEVSLPTYDFNEGIRKYLGNTAKLNEDEVIVVEGIHGLNEKSTAQIPRENKFKIYISALTTLNIDDYNRVTTSDTRLIRRMVRDSKFRGYDPAKTIRMWDSVRRGEEKYIFPYQDDADVMFNSSLVYEIAVLKSYVEPLLTSIKYDSDEFAEAKRLYEFLSYFVPLESNEIPINSIMREFIGDGCFYR